MNDFTEINLTPTEMRAMAATMFVEADRLEDQTLQDSGRRVMRTENDGSKTKSETGRYWLGIQIDKKAGITRNFAKHEDGYKNCEKPMSAGQRWEDSEFSQTMVGLFELISERYDNRGDRISLYAECLPDPS